MSFFSLVKELLKVRKDVPLPMECEDNYLIESKDNLKYHLMINMILEKNEMNSGFGSALETAYREVENKEEQFALSMALLEREAYLKDLEERPHHGYYYRYEQTADLFFSLHQATEEQYVTFFKFHNDQEKLYFYGQDEIVQQLESIHEKAPLSKPLVQELERAYQRSLGKRNTDNYHKMSPLAVRLGTLLGLYSPIEAFQEQIDATFANGTIERKLSDGYPLAKSDIYYEQQILLDDFLENNDSGYGNYTSKDAPGLYKDVVGQSREAQKDFAMAVIHRIAWQSCLSDHNYPLYQFVNSMIRKRLPFTEEDIIKVFKILSIKKISPWLFSSPSFLKNVEALVKDKGLSDELQKGLNVFLKKGEDDYRDEYSEKTRLKIQELFAQYGSGGNVDVQPFIFSNGDNFAAKATADLEAMDTAQKHQWYKLLRFAATASGGKPTKKFITKAEVLLKETDQKQMVTTLEDWLRYATKMELKGENYYATFFDGNNGVAIKGLLWMLSISKIESLDEALEKFIIRCFKKIPGIGPASGAVGNAGIYFAASRNSLTGVALLNRVRSRIAQRNTKGLITKYIDATAKELNIAVADLEDFSVPDFGMTDATKEIAFNDYKARISIPQMGKVLTEWIKPDGKQQKSIPSFVRTDFAEELKAMRAEIKLMPKTLSVQRDRLDRGYISKRKLPYAHFEKYYLNHGLMSYLTKRLVWVFGKDKQTVNAIYQDEKWIDVKGKEINWVTEAEVRLWHPLDSVTEEVLAWRDYMQTHEIKQPFKQAYREIYILTDAEVNTKTYSNRMASHILKQHQFNALAGLRGWKYSLLGAYDDGRDGEICAMKIPDYEMTAQFWVEGVYADDAWNDAGIYLYVTTDQVRFTNGDEVINLIDVPKIIFTEVMRDVDLFVGVGSVGNDPEWRDNGGLPRFRDYWQSYSFGDLTEVAKTRKSILEKLLPRLKIAKIAEIDGKFLKVKGSKHTYKIHIGSTNILMEPNDQYLCIVPDRNPKGTDKLFIPFEGDRGLSIVLSKAFMLAEDEKITDNTILSQIG